MEKLENQIMENIRKMEMYINEKYVNLITVGRLAPFKNIDKIILSLNQLRLTNSNLYKLIIVGDGPEKNNLKKLVSENDLTDFVTFTGQLNKDELNKHYRESDIYIQASGYEGLPHTLLEAISHNLSIVSTPIGGTNEILEDNTNGWTIDLIKGKYPDEKDIASKIKYLMKNKEEDELKKYKANLLLEEKFNKEKNFQEYIKTLENFINYE